MHMKKVIPMLFIAASLNAQAATRPDTADPYRWLEEVKGERAMSWVKAENAKTSAVLEADPRYADIYKEAFRMASAKDRIPYPVFIGGELYNFWQDSAHKRGIWRKTSLESYRSKSPAWVTVLDLDTLAAHEKANWVWQGVTCALPAERRCLLRLSDGGEDAVTIREFDLASRAFVANGFALPKGKQRVSWAGEDTLLVAREWKPGELTASGYPYITKRLARGQPLDAAVEIYRGDPKDVSVSAFTMTDGKGHRVSMIGRGLSFFETESYIVRPNDVARLNVPKKFEIQDLFDGQIIARLTQDWTAAGRTYKSGSVVSFDAAAAAKDPQNLAPTLIIEPGPRESISGVSSTKNQLLVGLDQNVKGRVLIFSRSPSGAWSRRTIALPDNASTEVRSTDARSDRAFINVTGFLTPSSVWLADAAKGSATTLKSLPPRFDASSQVVEQLEATSKDGTKIPYFLVHPKNMKRDGSNPTLLYSYGGFEVSLTPFYSGSIGKLWLERGGVYVLANIRGGGEFGPAWHDAGLKTHRQVIYDDFAAVAQELIAQKITSPRRLGIQGGSNGGLLMGVELTQHPELWSAVDIQVPLLDMLRFEQIAAGASWVGEYGSVSNPDERAFLESISPLHNLKAGVTYPMPLVWTTTKDDRVGPQHARKFAAKMADMKIPYLFYEVIEGGHGSGANIEQRAHTDALEFTYLARQLMDASKPTP